MGKEHDVKAPDGFLLGGERRVRAGGVILFQRGWWQLPNGFAAQGEYCHVHCTDGGASDLEVAPPGYQSFPAAASDGVTVRAPRTDRADAKPGYRRKSHKTWAVKQAATIPATGHAATVDPDDLRPWGYAPGEYVFRCRDCPADPPFEQRPLGDKRSWRCKPHAEAARDASGHAATEGEG